MLLLLNEKRIWLAMTCLLWVDFERQLQWSVFTALENYVSKTKSLPYIYHALVFLIVDVASIKTTWSILVFSLNRLHHIQEQSKETLSTVSNILVSCITCHTKSIKTKERNKWGWAVPSSDKLKLNLKLSSV